MIRPLAGDPLLTLSVQVYRLLLRAYPRPFRDAYGPHMLQVFGDCCRRALRQGGPPNVLAYWAITLLDLVRSVVEQRLQRETTMNKENFIRLSGWLLALGALAFHVLPIAFFASGDVWPRLGALELAVITGYFYGPIAMALGMLGLLARYRHETGGLAQGALGLGALGGVVAVVGNIGQALEPNLFWNVHVAGLLLEHAGLALFGLAARARKLGPRPVVLALLASLPLLVVGPAQLAIAPASLGMPAALAMVAGAIGWVLSGAGLLLEKRPALAPA
jgi:hypothetical protein